MNLIKQLMPSLAGMLVAFGIGVPYASAQNGSCSVSVRATADDSSNFAHATVDVKVRFKTPFETISQSYRFNDVRVPRVEEAEQTANSRGIVYTLSATWENNQVVARVRALSKYGSAFAIGRTDIHFD